MPVIYIDVLFFVNFIIDLFLLYCTGKLADVRTKPLRIFFGAVFGGLYSVMIFFPAMAAAYLAICKIAASALILLISFKIRHWRKFVRLIICFYITNFIFGGAVTFIMYFTDFGGKTNTMLSNGSFYCSISFSKLFFTAAIVTICFKFIVTAIKTYLLKQGIICSVTISAGLKKVTVSGLFDTGNSLCDPISTLPVIVADLSALKPLFDDEISEFIKAGDIESIYEKNAFTDFCWRLVPYRSLGNPNGLIPAFRPSAVTVRSENLPERDVECIIGISANRLSASGYKAILNPLILRKAD